MRTGTTRARLWLIGGLFLGGVVGCSGDEQSVRISQAITLLTDATSKLSEVKASVKKAVDASTESKRPITAPDENLRVAIETAKDLRKLASDPLEPRRLTLQHIKEYTARLKDVTSPAQSKELAARYRGALREGLTNLEKEEAGLNIVLAQAEDRADANGKEYLATLKDELKHAREAFDLLNTQR